MNRCEHCPLRARYDRAPRSIAGRLWRWHIRFCPGWKSYFAHLPPDTRAEVARRYAIPER